MPASTTAGVAAVKTYFPPPQPERARFGPSNPDNRHIPSFADGSAADNLRSVADFAAPGSPAQVWLGGLTTFRNSGLRTGTPAPRKATLRFYAPQKPQLSATFSRRFPEFFSELAPSERAILRIRVRRSRELLAADPDVGAATYDAAKRPSRRTRASAAVHPMFSGDRFSAASAMND